MPLLLRLRWILFLPLRIFLWPAIWYDRRKRRLRKRPDEWHWADRFLCNENHVVMAFGYFPWEKGIRWCWPCLALWVLVILTTIGLIYVL